MITKKCFVCEEKVSNPVDGVISKDQLLEVGWNIPKGMSDEDLICRKCNREVNPEQTKELCNISSKDQK